MPQISVRGLEMPESPIRKLAPLAVAAKNRGIKVYHLNIGQPDVPTPQIALDAIHNIDRKVLEYSPSQGYLSYRKKLTGYYKSYGINVNPDDIIITCGGSEAVLFAFMSCLNPGDEIIVPEPAYANYMAFAVSAGAKSVLSRQLLRKASLYLGLKSLKNLSTTVQEQYLFAIPIIRLDICIQDARCIKYETWSRNMIYIYSQTKFTVNIFILAHHI